MFNERSGTLFAGMKYRPSEVVFALRLRFNYRLSSREASELMVGMGHPVSRNTVLFWADMFHGSFQELQRGFLSMGAKGLCCNLIICISGLRSRLTGLFDNSCALRLESR
ncbi:hypothetical protein DRO56_05385 [Candidatus Bathyarchaeota archaeon]|nr:MAG: hypothetical protein DRO56_05385 [Candidatus Bathyarchaeota archaeon]